MARGPLRHFDWNLRSCGRHGHETYAPDEEALAQRLHASTPAGDAWRCLRCGDWVLGEPRHRGPADRAPIVLRGRALRDAFVLRFLALERALRGLLLVALAYGVWRFEGSQQALQKVFESYLPAIRPLADRLGVDLQETGPVHLIQRAFAASHSTLLLVALGVLAYGALELLEAVGLWLMKRWGEYVAVVGTAVFIPLEVYELVEKVTWLRIAAFEAERRGDSLLEVEQAAARDAVAVGTR